MGGGAVTAVHISVPCPSWTCLVKSSPPSRTDPSSTTSPAAGPVAGYRLPQARADSPQLLTDAPVPSLRAREWSPMPAGPSEPSPPFPSPLAPGGWSKQRQDALPAAAGWCSRGGPAGVARPASLLPFCRPQELLSECLLCAGDPGLVLAPLPHRTRAVYFMSLGWWQPL